MCAVCMCTHALVHMCGAHTLLHDAHQNVKNLNVMCTLRIRKEPCQLAHADSHQAIFLNLTMYNI